MSDVCRLCGVGFVVENLGLDGADTKKVVRGVDLLEEVLLVLIRPLRHPAFRFRVQGSSYRIQGAGCRIQGSWPRVLGSWFLIRASEIGLQRSRVQGCIIQGVKVKWHGLRAESKTGLGLRAAGFGLRDNFGCWEFGGTSFRGPA